MPKNTVASHEKEIRPPKWSIKILLIFKDCMRSNICAIKPKTSADIKRFSSSPEPKAPDIINIISVMFTMHAAMIKEKTPEANLKGESMEFIAGSLLRNQTAA